MRIIKNGCCRQFNRSAQSRNANKSIRTRLAVDCIWTASRESTNFIIFSQLKKMEINQPLTMKLEEQVQERMDARYAKRNEVALRLRNMEAPEHATSKKAVRCKWVYKIECNPSDEIVKFKARWIAKGFTQRPGIYYTETFAPVYARNRSTWWWRLKRLNTWKQKMRM